MVLMPQARAKHQPRSASNNPNPPAAASSNPSQGEALKLKAAQTSSASPSKPRKILPALPMLSEKNDFMDSIRRGLAQVVQGRAQTCQIFYLDRSNFLQGNLISGCGTSADEQGNLGGQ